MAGLYMLVPQSRAVLCHHTAHTTVIPAPTAHLRNITPDGVLTPETASLCVHCQLVYTCNSHNTTREDIACLCNTTREDICSLLYNTPREDIPSCLYNTPRSEFIDTPPGVGYLPSGFWLRASCLYWLYVVLGAITFTKEYLNCVRENTLQN